MYNAFHSVWKLVKSLQKISITENDYWVCSLAPSLLRGSLVDNDDQEIQNKSSYGDRDNERNGEITHLHKTNYCLLYIVLIHWDESIS